MLLLSELGWQFIALTVNFPKTGNWCYSVESVVSSITRTCFQAKRSSIKDLFRDWTGVLHLYLCCGVLWTSWSTGVHSTNPEFYLNGKAVSVFLHKGFPVTGAYCRGLFFATNAKCVSLLGWFFVYLYFTATLFQQGVARRAEKYTGGCFAWPMFEALLLAFMRPPYFMEWTGPHQTGCTPRYKDLTRRDLIRVVECCSKFFPERNYKNDL